MPSIDVPKKAPIYVKSKPDNVEVVIKHPTKPTTHPNDYNFLWPLADIYVVQKGKEEGYFLSEYQEDGIEKPFEPPIVLVVDLPRYITTNPNLKPESEKLIYFEDSRSEWIRFDNVNRISADQVEVTISSWIKDPPVGWGGDFL